MAKPSKSQSQLKTASVLAFERKLSPSSGVMSSGAWELRGQKDAFKPLPIQEKAVRGTISHRLKNAVRQDPLKLDAQIQKPNLQRVDEAALPADANTLKVSFTLRVLGNLATPSSCNDHNYQRALSAVVQQYQKEHGMSLLALRYAENIANGRFLWRNRVGADAVEVRVTLPDLQVLQFDALTFSLREFGTHSSQLSSLAKVIQQGLEGTSGVLLRVEAYARLGAGQEVFPSQELVLDKSEGDKSKILYSVDGVAALHSQKIGNAIRTVDTWHPEAAEQGPIAAEIYGAVTSRGQAFRGIESDFYTLLDNWVLKGEAPDVDQQHFVIAMLVRGGVFGDSGKE